MTSSPYNEAKSESSDPSNNMNTSSIYEANLEYHTGVNSSSQAVGHNDMMMDDIVDSTDDLEDLDDFDTENTYGHLQKKSSSGGNGGSVGTSSAGGGSNNEGGVLFEDDKKKRRAIANSNERRRMQSINAGFQTLKSLIPHSSGEKLSKACILQRSAEHMRLLSKEKEKLSVNFQLALKIIESNGLLSQYQTSSLDSTNTASQHHHHHQSHHHSKSTVKHLVETTNNNIVQSDTTSSTANDSTLISSAQSASTGTPVKAAANITSKRKSISSLVNSPPPSSSLSSSAAANQIRSGLDSSLIVKSPSNKISAHLSQQQFIQDEMKNSSNQANAASVTVPAANRQLTDATNLNKPPYSSIASIANIAAAAAAAVVAANHQPTSVYPISTATSQPIQLTLDTTAKKLNEIFVTDHANVSSSTNNQQTTGNIIQLQPATNASGLQLNLNALDIRLLNGSGNATASDLILPTAVILDTSRAVLQPLVAANSVSTAATPTAILTQQSAQQHQSDTDDNEEEFEEYDDEPDEQESNNNNKSGGRQIKPSTHVVANTKPIKIKNMTTNTIGPGGHHHPHSQHPSGVKSARSNSIDQLIAAAVATSPSSSSTCSTTSSASTSTASSVSNPATLANMGTSSLVTPTVSFQPSSSSVTPAVTSSSNPIMIVDDVLAPPAPAPSLLARKNLNTIVEAIKHVEGKNYVDEFADMNLKINTTTVGASCSSDASSSSSGGSSSSSSSSSSALAYSPGSGTNKEAYLISKVSPTAQKPPKKRKYTTEDLGNLAEPSQQLQQQQQQQIVPTNRPGSPTATTGTEGFLSLLVKSN